MTVCIIHEENHGTIGVAKNLTAAKQWLIENNWVNKVSDIYDEETEQVNTLEGKYGHNWLDYYKSFSADDLESMGFYFDFETVIEESGW
jgi:hypothetical protein